MSPKRQSPDWHHVTPEALVAWLKSHGWEALGEHPRYQVWAKGRSRAHPENDAIVPLDTDAPDYGPLISNTLAAICRVEGRFEEVKRQLEVEIAEEDTESLKSQAFI